MSEAPSQPILVTNVPAPNGSCIGTIIPKQDSDAALWGCNLTLTPAISTKIFELEIKIFEWNYKLFGGCMGDVLRRCWWMTLTPGTQLLITRSVYRL